MSSWPIHRSSTVGVDGYRRAGAAVYKAVFGSDTSCGACHLAAGRRPIDRQFRGGGCGGRISSALHRAFRQIPTGCLGAESSEPDDDGEGERDDHGAGAAAVHEGTGGKLPCPVGIDTALRIVLTPLLKPRNFGLAAARNRHPTSGRRSNLSMGCLAASSRLL
jgi:hypothetical protein